MNKSIIKGFSVSKEQYYMKNMMPNEDVIMFGLYVENDGCIREGAFRWHDIGSEETSPRLELFEDAWDIFSDMPELLNVLRETEKKNVTVEQMKKILKKFGLSDLTKRQAPIRYK